jgi:hypothetical protein
MAMKRALATTLGSIMVALLLVALAGSAQAQREPPGDWGPRERIPNLNGTWYMNGNPDQPTRIIQREPDGRALFINEKGSRARGTVSPDRVFIPDWSDGYSDGLVGRIRRDRIVWPDGNYWSR